MCQRVSAASRIIFTTINMHGIINIIKCVIKNCYDINTLTQEAKMDENTIKSKLDNTWEKIQKKIETEKLKE